MIEAEDGAIAVAQYASHREKIAVVVTDIMMPVMDGAAMAHALCKIEPAVKIVGSSGFFGDDNQSDRVAELKRAGVRTMLQKPFTTRELLEAVAAELKTDEFEK